MKYIVETTIVSIERRERKVWAHGKGEFTVFRNVDLGFFMLLEGSHESIHIGFDQPVFRPGDRIRISFERIENVGHQ